MDSKYSVVEFFPESNGTACGYCKSTDGNYNIGMWAHTMTVADYQDLIDRGWRRSGQYCYKPTLTVTCCPLYTIKCDALNVKLSKSQKKLLKRMSKFLKEGQRSNCTEKSDNDSDISEDAEPSGTSLYDKKISKIIEEKSGHNVPDINEITHDAEPLPHEEKIENRLSDGVNEVCVRATEMNDKGNCGIPVEKFSKKNLKAPPRPGIGMDTSKPKCKKAKLLRLERKKKKMEEKNNTDNINKKRMTTEKSLEDFIQESNSENCINKLELRLVRSCPRSNEFEETFQLEHKLFQKYQMAIHKDPITKVNELQFTRFLVSSPLKIRLVPSKSNFNESWQLFVKYQTTIHKEKEEECDLRTYDSFLVESPLQAKNQNKSLSCGYGSFHQQYWLNGKLIAVGVIDILPKCVSSVYFFYDPDYSFLSLGTYGSLRELELVQKLHKESPELCEYYMGYYVHSCPKMRYKARLSPSFLLCPEVYTWHPIQYCQLNLDRTKYSRFNEDLDAVCDDSFINLNKVMILWKQIAMPYSSYKMRAKNVGISEDNEVTQYAELVGRKCAERMLLYRY